MKVLVTGGSGYLGTHIRKYFGADDLSRRSGLDILKEGDSAIAHDYDLIIHLAALMDKSTYNDASIFRTNVDGALNVLREIPKGASFVFISTKDVYGRFADRYPAVPEECPTEYVGQSPLEWSKLIAERYVSYYANRNQFRSCIFRLSTPYAAPSIGNIPNFVGHYADAINRGEPIELPAGGSPVRDLLHVNDLAKACEAFHESVINHGLYNLGGGPASALSLKQIVEKVAAVAGLQATYTNDAEVPAPVPFNYITDLSLVRKELDWDPSISLDEGLSCLLEPVIPVSTR